MCLDVAPGKAGEQRVLCCPEPVHAQRKLGRLVVEHHPGFGPIEADTIEPSPGEPARMRKADAQVIERSLAVGDVCGPRG